MNKNKLKITLLLGLMSLAQSFTCQQFMRESNSSNDKSESSVYRYSDGAGNGYRISHTGNEDDPILFSYSPIKPEFSSSGTYDGGEPVKKEMIVSEYLEIRELFEKCLSSDENTLQKRSMGSGRVSSNVEGEIKDIILNRRDSRNMALFRWLSDFKEEGE